MYSANDLTILGKEIGSWPNSITAILLIVKVRNDLSTPGDDVAINATYCRCLRDLAHYWVQSKFHIVQNGYLHRTVKDAVTGYMGY